MLSWCRSLRRTTTRPRGTSSRRRSSGRRRRRRPRRRRRWTSCSISRYSSRRRRSGPGFLSSSAPLPRRGGGRGRREEEEASSSHLLSAFAVQKTVEIPQLQFFNIVVDIPFVPQTQILTVQLFSRPQSFLSCRTFQVGDVPVVLVVCWLRCASAVFLLVVARKFGRYGPEGQLQWRECTRAVFSSLVRRPMMLGIMAFMDQKFRDSVIFKAGFAGYNTPRAVLSFLGRRPMKLCIMAGMVQKDSCSGMARLVLLVTVHRVLCFFLCLQARDARHHGRYGLEGFVRLVQGLFCWVLTMHFALCSLVCRLMMLDIMAVLDQKDTHVMVPLVRLQTVESPAVAVHRWSSTSLSRCRGSLMVQTVRQTLDSPVAVQGGRRPCLQVVQISPVVAQRLVPWSRLVVGPWSFHSLSSTR